MYARSSLSQPAAPPTTDLRDPTEAYAPACAPARPPGLQPGGFGDAAEAAKRANRRDAVTRGRRRLETAEDPKVKAKLQQVLEGL